MIDDFIEKIKEMTSDDLVKILKKAGIEFTPNLNKNNISVSYSYTVNLGNYESIKIQVGNDRSLKLNEIKNEEINKEYDNLEKIILEKVELIKNKNKSKRHRPV